MRNLNRPRPHTAAPSDPRRRSLRTDHPSAHRPSAQLIADGVVAGYIHDISERRPRYDPAFEDHERRLAA